MCGFGGMAEQVSVNANAVVPIPDSMALAAEVTEKWHLAIREIHDRYGLEYRYGPLHDFMERTDT